MSFWRSPKMTVRESERYEEAVQENEQQEVRVELLQRRYWRLLREAELLSRKESRVHGAH